MLLLEIIGFPLKYRLSLQSSLKPNAIPIILWSMPHFCYMHKILLTMRGRILSCFSSKMSTWHWHRSSSHRLTANVARKRRDILCPALGTYITVPAVWVRGRAATFVVYSVYRTGVPYSDSSSSRVHLRDRRPHTVPRTSLSLAVASGHRGVSHHHEVISRSHGAPEDSYRARSRKYQNSQYVCQFLL